MISREKTDSKRGNAMSKVVLQVVTEAGLGPRLSGSTPSIPKR